MPGKVKEARHSETPPKLAGSRELVVNTFLVFAGVGEMDCHQILATEKH